MNTAPQVEGTFNVRDVAGAGLGAGGQALRTGVLWRTAGLSRLTSQGVAELAAWGVTEVLDLRTDQERERDGADRVPTGATVHPLSFDPDEQVAATHGSADPVALLRAAIAAGRGDAAREWMESVYRGFVLSEQARASTAAGLRVLADNDGATVVHCSAGKDRTGWFVALVLSICGVTRADIVGDYLVSQQAAAQLGALVPPTVAIPHEVLEPMIGVNAAYLDAAFMEVDKGYGSVDGYLDAIGIGPAERRTIAGRFGLLPS